VATREWARVTATGARVKTTYSYNAARELAGKTYNDGTPSVTSITYNRRGQVASLTDATGPRAFRYDDYGLLQREELPAWFNSRRIDWDYDAYGRRTQVGLFGQGVWPEAPTEKQFVQTYTYDAATGRLASVGSESPVNGNAALRDNTYAYFADSNIFSTMAQAWAGYTTTRTLETKRDAIASHSQASPTYEAIKVTCTARDALGRITSSERDNTTAPDATWVP
jgi:YD repeat-containing protein